MEKDIDKILSRTLLTYFSILFVVFALKLFGIDYFGLNTDNGIIHSINDFIKYWRLESLWYMITLFINTYIILAISCNDNSRNMLKFTLITMLLNMSIQILKTMVDLPYMFVFTDLLYLFILALCYIKIVKRDKICRENITNYFVFTLATIIMQFISLVTRNVVITNQTNFITYCILDIDYLLLLFMSYKLYFIKGGRDLWAEVLGSFSVLLVSLKSLPEKLQKSYNLAKPKDRVDELTNKIYIVLFWLYNFFTVVVVLLIATLNHTFVECIFILSSFWINKGVFGKPLHLKKASHCFIVSSLSYYILNRLTWSINMSFLIPVILGIALSYITAKLVANHENLYLHRGMSLDNFYTLITKVTSNEEHIDICKRFYVDKESNLKIALHCNYSEINIKKIKQNINKKIKELYK